VARIDVRSVFIVLVGNLNNRCHLADLRVDGNRSQWPRGLSRGSAAARLLGSWVRIPQGAWMTVVSVVCCQVEVSASGRSFVQRSPTKCGASECHREVP